VRSAFVKHLFYDLKFNLNRQGQVGELQGAAVDVATADLDFPAGSAVVAVTEIMERDRNKQPESSTAAPGGEPHSRVLPFTLVFVPVTNP